MLNNLDANNFIKKSLNKNNPYLIGRSGIVELRSCFSIYYYQKLSNQLLYLLQHNAGVYGDCIEVFFYEYTNSITNADMNVFWTQSDLKEVQDILYSKFSPSSIKFENRAVEPYYFDNPWSSCLKDKKVLVIHPFSESIKYQYKNRNNLWTQYDILPEFNLITYRSIQSINNIGPHNSWIESLNIMKEEISNLNFDIALIGCGAYGLPLGSFIKTKMNKIAIHMGGALQILFGIKGYRWDNHEEISKMYNSFWIRPKDNEKPSMYQNIEGGCYW